MAETIIMPKLTATMQAGKIYKWYKKENEYVNQGEVILEVIADKAVMQIEVPMNGYLLKICYQEDLEVRVGTVLAYIGQKKEIIEETLPEEKAAAINKIEKKHSELMKEEQKLIEKYKATPVAKNMAKELGLNLEQINGTGRGGLINRRDIENYLENKVDKGDNLFISLDGNRRVMAERMAHSRQTAAHATTVAEIDMQKVYDAMELRKFGYTAAVIFSAALALKEYPLINSSLDEVNKKILLHKEINVSCAVSTEGGLLVPVIRNAGAMDVFMIEAELKRLANKAQENQLPSAEMDRGTFTVTNSGVFGSLFFAPIINQPQSAIIGMGKVMDTPVVRDKQVVIRPMMYLSLSYDHRIIEGSIAVRFLQKVKAVLENWQ